MSHRKLAALLALVAALTISAPVGAARFGQPDGAEHPYVGELFFYVPDAVDPRFDDPGGWFSCTGTLVTPTVVVTAGHCVFGVGLDGESTTDGGEATTTADGGDGGNDIWIDFSEAAHFAGLPPSADYGRGENQQRYDDRAAWLNAHPDWIRGTAHPHPLYDDNSFFTHDAGVIVLEAPVGGANGDVAFEGWLDQYAAAAHASQTFETVGYGLTKSGPFTAEGGDTRVKALITLHTLNAQPRDSYAVFSNTPSTRASGGICFGDSGGPIFDDTNSNVIVAVNSWVLGVTCSGLTGGYRLDQPDDIAFLAQYGVTP